MTSCSYCDKIEADFNDDDAAWATHIRDCHENRDVTWKTENVTEGSLHTKRGDKALKFDFQNNKSVMEAKLMLTNLQLGALKARNPTRADEDIFQPVRRRRRLTQRLLHYEN